MPSPVPAEQTELADPPGVGQEVVEEVRAGVADRVAQLVLGDGPRQVDRRGAPAHQGCRDPDRGGVGGAGVLGEVAAHQRGEGVGAGHVVDGAIDELDRARAGQGAGEAGVGAPDVAGQDPAHGTITTRPRLRRASSYPRGAE
jgi:hypothetical protein